MKFLRNLLRHKSSMIDLSTERGYDIACAMRGPDIEVPGSGALKIVVTGRIRALAGAGPVYGVVRHRHISIDTAGALCAYLPAMRATPGLMHYLGHALRAADHLGAHDLGKLIGRLAYDSMDPFDLASSQLTPEMIVELAGGEEA